VGTAINNIRNYRVGMTSTPKHALLRFLKQKTKEINQEDGGKM